MAIGKVSLVVLPAHCAALRDAGAPARRDARDCESTRSACGVARESLDTLACARRSRAATTIAPCVAGTARSSRGASSSRRRSSTARFARWRCTLTRCCSSTSRRRWCRFCTSRCARSSSTRASRDGDGGHDVERRMQAPPALAHAERRRAGAPRRYVDDGVAAARRARHVGEQGARDALAGVHDPQRHWRGRVVLAWQRGRRQQAGDARTKRCCCTRRRARRSVAAVCRLAHAQLASR
jgi:hypothetical protein